MKKKNDIATYVCDKCGEKVFWTGSIFVCCGCQTEINDCGIKRINPIESNWMVECLKRGISL